MPQTEPFTLELQFNSTLLIIGVTVLLLSAYVIPQLAKIITARMHLSI